MSDSSPVSTDAIDTLIQRCLAGDQQAWEEIVRQHRRKVFNIAYKFTGKHDEAEDLTQDIFLKIFKSLHTFDRRANFQTWLVSVSRNLCIDHYRSVRKERETIDRDVDAGELMPAATDAERLRRARTARPRRTAAPGDGRTAADAAQRRHAARHPGAVLPGDRRASSTCRKAPSSPASTAAAPSWPARSSGCATRLEGVHG